MVERRRREHGIGARLYRLLHDGWIALVQRFQCGAVGDLWKEERLEIADRTHFVQVFDGYPCVKEFFDGHDEADLDERGIPEAKAADAIDYVPHLHPLLLRQDMPVQGLDGHLVRYQVFGER
jgi:hypothetical protein